MQSRLIQQDEQNIYKNLVGSLVVDQKVDMKQLEKSISTKLFGRHRKAMLKTIPTLDPI